MVRQLDAIYEHGVFRPLEPLELSERLRVRLTVDDRGRSSGEAAKASSEPVNDRREEFRWLAEQSTAYAGKWVALDGDRLVAYGEDLPSVRAASRAAGVERPLLTRLPVEGELPFGGW